ncbi:hypothetical protein SEA_PHARAOH_17 [Mycobacterium phage Pharaoh]|uniref:Head-to-tail connector protein n=1 Tax=Mycobacterium phage Pharaoh TaxID=2530140 RepID=A0A481W226_9CAUD|nr:hypothetical protein KIV59_gp73 [Mycobacterium phage Pharaoh]QBJ00206.1 hypothetical protein SEA_PHARAOH_17 [Mycobacterium phage Pharaoh]
MQIRSTINGGVAEVDDDYAERLIEAGGWELAEALTAPHKPRRARRTKEQIAADKAAEAAKNQE